jgi:hypothetical protein
MYHATESKTFRIEVSDDLFPAAIETPLEKESWLNQHNLDQIHEHEEEAIKSSEVSMAKVLRIRSRPNNN